ncbi:hypothetical protein M2280_004339 [Prescottella agglutinans]|uniref:Uncharacterized protein n=2 Tax=Prescottella agglutinans TaxID=1644129 RepID=A0ABT6MFK4_9NOCA|nr:hypothetical protein [Prescottella agglutinans]
MRSYRTAGVLLLGCSFAITACQSQPAPTEPAPAAAGPSVSAEPVAQDLPSAPRAGDFCTRLREMGEKAETIPDDDGLVTVATYQADTLTEIRPLAPAALQSDVDTLIESYRSFSGQMDGTTVGTGMAGLSIVSPDAIAARGRIATHCGLPQ